MKTYRGIISMIFSTLMIPTVVVMVFTTFALRNCHANAQTNSNNRKNSMTTTSPSSTLLTNSYSSSTPGNLFATLTTAPQREH